MAEMLEYASALTSLTGGKGAFHMEFSHYEEVPAHAAGQDRRGGAGAPAARAPRRTGQPGTRRRTRERRDEECASA